MSGPNDVSGAFGSLDERVRKILADLPTPRLTVLTALAIAKDVGLADLTAANLSNGLHLAGVDLTPVGVTNALRATRGLVARRRNGRKVSYNVMTAGVRAVAAAELKSDDGVNV